MKGNTAKHILKWLSERRFRDFVAYAKLEVNGEYVASMCRYFRKHQVTTEEGTCAHFQITPQQYYYRISVIGQRLTTFMAGSKGSVFLHQTLWLADDMICEMQFGVAEDLIQNGTKAAVEIEDFDLALRFCHLVDLLPEEFRPTDLNVSAISGLRRNLVAYEDLYDMVRQAGDIPEVEARRKAMRDFLKDPLLSMLGQARSNKASYLCKKAQYFCHVHLGEYPEAIPLVGDVIQLLGEFAHLGRHSETSIAKETKILAQLLGLTQQESLYRETISNFEEMPLRSKRAQFERIFVKYPVATTFAIQHGNEKELTMAIEGFLRFFEDSSLPFPDSFAIENLYDCAYGAIVLGRDDLWELTFPRLGTYEKSSFPRLFYPMFRFLEVIRSVDKKEWEDAIRHLKNLRSIKQLKGFEDFDEALAMFSTVIQTWAIKDRVDWWVFDTTFWDVLYDHINQFDFGNYFDLNAWLLSHERKCSMIEVIYQRTLLSKKESLE